MMSTAMKECFKTTMSKLKKTNKHECIIEEDVVVCQIH